MWEALAERTRAVSALALVFATVACEGLLGIDFDDVGTTDQRGEAGTAGADAAGGTAGSAGGSAGTAGGTVGDGGTAGSASGSAGSEGGAAGGSAGTEGGAAGDGGTAGSASGSAGTEGGAAGDGGTAGSAGGVDAGIGEGDSGPDGSDSDAGCTAACPESAPVCNAGQCRRVLSISVGGAHVCALVEGGKLFCWGANNAGQLGDGSRNDRERPAPVHGLGDVVHVAAGYGHTCALTRAGSVWCWGTNTLYELGSTTGPDSPLPVEVEGITGTVSRLGAHGLTGYPDAHTCAELTNGKVMCWGANRYGQLGDGTTEQRSSPVFVKDLDYSNGLVVGPAGGCSTRPGPQRNILLCWGNNEFQMLGTGSTDAKVTTPMPVTDLVDIYGVTAGADLYCAITGLNRSVVCWGSDWEGAVGDGPDPDPYRFATSPMPVALTGAAQVQAGWRSACARLTDGRVYCWGFNRQGVLGIGRTGASTDAPTDPVALAGPAAQIDLRWQLACALLRSGRVQCWGNGGADPDAAVATPRDVEW